MVTPTIPANDIDVLVFNHIWQTQVGETMRNARAEVVDTLQHERGAIVYLHNGGLHCSQVRQQQGNGGVQMVQGDVPAGATILFDWHCHPTKNVAAGTRIGAEIKAAAHPSIEDIQLADQQTFPSLVITPNGKALHPEYSGYFQKGHFKLLGEYEEARSGINCVWLCTGSTARKINNDYYITGNFGEFWRSSGLGQLMRLPESSVIRAMRDQSTPSYEQLDRRVRARHE